MLVLKISLQPNHPSNLLECTLEQSKSFIAIIPLPFRHMRSLNWFVKQSDWESPSCIVW